MFGQESQVPESTSASQHDKKLSTRHLPPSVDLQKLPLLFFFLLNIFLIGKPCGGWMDGWMDDD